MQKRALFLVLIMRSFVLHTMDSPQEELNRELSRAIVHHDNEKIARLLNAGADVNYAGTDKRTLLYYAVSSKNNIALRLLLAHPNIKVNAADTDGWTPLQIALDGFKESSKPSKRSAQQEAIRLLLAHPAIRVNGIDTDAWHPLHLAVQKNNLEAIRLLLAHPNINVDMIDKMDKEGWTPLHWAAMLNYQEAAILLIAWGADINSLDVKNSTPLIMTCANRIIGHEKMVALLLSHNALKTLKNIDGKTALDYAENPQIRALLAAEHRPLIDARSRTIFLDHARKNRNIATIITNRERGKKCLARMEQLSLH